MNLALLLFASVAFGTTVYDEATHANLNDVTTGFFDLSVEIDFNTKKIIGT